MLFLPQSLHYRVWVLISTKKTPFKLEEVVATLNPPSTKGEIQRVLNNLRDNGVIYEHGSYYSISDRFKKK